MKRVQRKERRKVAARSHADSNPFIQTVSIRPSNPSPGVMKGQHQSLVHEPRRKDGYCPATAFGRPYHTTASQVADREAQKVADHGVSQLDQIPSGPELAGIFDAEGDNMHASSATTPRSFHTVARSEVSANGRQGERKSIPGNQNPFIPRKAMSVSEQKHTSSLIPCHAPYGHRRLQDQNESSRISLQKQQGNQLAIQAMTHTEFDLNGFNEKPRRKLEDLSDSNHQPSSVYSYSFHCQNTSLPEELLRFQR